LDRPTQDAHFHSFGVDTDSYQVLSGRDGLAGGTWFGINRTGKVALLTNITEPPKRYSTSRGDLVSSFLLSNPTEEEEEEEDDLALEDRVNKTLPVDAKYAGFNLLLLSPALTSGSMIRYESLLVTNHGGGGPVTSRHLSSSERSCGALSNGIDGAGATLWPKVQYASAHFPAVVESRSADMTDVQLVERLFQLLAWQPQDCTISQRSELRKTVQVSPIAISTISGNLPSALYGTRLSTILLVRNNGQVVFIERDVWKLGDAGVPIKADPPTERKYNFKLDFKSTECSN